MEAVATAVGDRVRAEELSAVEGAAKRNYEQSLAEGGSHARGWDQYMATLLRCAGLEAAHIPDAVEALKQAHAEFNLWRRVPRGVREALQQARGAGLRLAVISNSEGQLPRLFERVGLEGLFEHIVDSAIEGVRKPDAQIFERALERMSVRAEESLYAGDLVHVDVEASMAVGMRAALIDPYGFYPDYARAPRYGSVVELVDALLEPGSG